MALAEFGIFLSVFVDFSSSLGGLGPTCKYFLKTEGPTITFTNVWGLL
jgi:hypothetical protein